MRQFFLPHGVHFCYRGDAAIFLDLRRDEYTLLAGENAAKWRALADPENLLNSDGNWRRDFLIQLGAKGLVTQDGAAGKALMPTEVETATDSLIEREADGPLGINARHIATFFRACATAAILLRWCPIEHTVARIERRKAQPLGFRIANPSTTIELTNVFLRLRSFFPRDYLCLYDSLALLEFLASYRTYPNWVFGVMLEPWAAHCWVQQGALMLNEELEVASTYTPVMAV